MIKALNKQSIAKKFARAQLVNTKDNSCDDPMSGMANNWSEKPGAEPARNAARGWRKQPCAIS
jgi:hypothetical protein